MRKSLLYFAMLAAFVACHKEPAAPEEHTENPVVTPPDPPAEVVFDGACSISASFAEAIVDGVPAWAAGDTVKLFGAEGATAELTFASQAGGSAVFSGTANMKGPFHAIWPASAAASFADGVFTTSIPAEQTLGAAVSPGALVAVAKTTDSVFTFKNVCSLLKVEIGSEGITGATLQTRDGSPLAGAFKVDSSTGAVSEVVDGKDAIVLKPSGDSFAPGTYYVAVIPGKKIEVSGLLTAPPTPGRAHARAPWK